MLEFKIVKHPDDIKIKLQQFNPQETTWIVSDLKSKQEIQDLCLQKFGFYSDESILRVSDFWKTWLRRLAPQIHLVSSEFIRILVRQYLEKFGHDVGVQPHEAQTLYKYISDLAPLLLHQQSHEYLKEWLKQKENPPFWLKWEIISQNCLKYIITEHRCIETSWIVSFLQGQALEKIVLPRKLIFDLGSQMTSLEMGLLNVLSKKNHIEVIVPDPDWKHKFSYILRTYSDYSGYGKNEIQPVQNAPAVITEDQFLRFSSEVNEVKFATQKIRQWIEQGVDPEYIVVLSPRIEDYWPILKYHLDVEGIPTQKDLVSSTMSLGIIQRWSALILAQTHHVSWTKLEMSYGYLQENSDLQHFEKFKSLFSEMLDESDLNRSLAIKDLFYQKINFEDSLTRDQFLALMLKSWIHLDGGLQHKNLFQNITKDFIQQTLPLSLKVKDWFDLISSRLAKKEVKIAAAVQTGIQVLPINSAQILTATHRLWIGLDEAGLKGRQNSLIPVSDIGELKKLFDLALEYPEESHADFNLRWYSQSPAEQQFFTCSHISATGEPLNTSLYFLEHNKKPVSGPDATTVLDSLQNIFNPHDHQDLKTKLDLELKPDPIKITHLEVKSLSPSDLETYSQCSFKFLARKGFNLQQFDALGFEIDPRQRGHLVHDLFKFIISDKNYLTLKKSDLSSHLETLRREKNLFPHLDLFWAPNKERLILAGMKFIDVEKSRLAALTNVQHKTEQTVQIFYDLKNHEFLLEPPPHEHFLVRGRLDRLDYDKNSQQGLVIDYKSGKGDATSFARKWVTNSEFQLLLYSIATEKIFNLKTVGALYYFYKNFEHQYGYILESDNVFKDHVHFTRSTLISVEDRQQIEIDFMSRIKQVFIGIENRIFSVRPANEKICDTCEWIDTCRIKSQR